MGNSAVKFKIMPESLDTDLESVKEKVKTTIKEMDGVFDSFEEQPIAFGLKALIVTLAYPESKEVDELGNAFNDVEGISSCEMIDYRRAIG
ncbi:MAG: elongation factor 1-beta [archaeon]